MVSEPVPLLTALRCVFAQCWGLRSRTPLLYEVGVRNIEGVDLPIVILDGPLECPSRYVGSLGTTKPLDPSVALSDVTIKVGYYGGGFNMEADFGGGFNLEADFGDGC
jgi:hypothetical protein